MDQTKRRKAQFYRVKSKMEALEARVRELEGGLAMFARWVDDPNKDMEDNVKVFRMWIAKTMAIGEEAAK